jgi:hypothetical protein
MDSRLHDLRFVKQQQVGVPTEQFRDQGDGAVATCKIEPHDPIVCHLMDSIDACALNAGP